MADRTKKALAAALKRFLNQTTLDKITVTDIAAACDINRQTFYYHFQDIYALGQWMFAQDINEVLGGETGYEHWRDNLLKILLYVEENKVMMQNVYHSIDREQLEKWLYQANYEMFSYMMAEDAKPYGISAEDQNFYTAFYSYALSGWILNWVKTGMREDPVGAVEKICVLLDNGLHGGAGTSA